MVLTVLYTLPYCFFKATDSYNVDNDRKIGFISVAIAGEKTRDGHSRLAWLEQSQS